MLDHSEAGQWYSCAGDDIRFREACKVGYHHLGISEDDCEKIRHICFDYWRRERRGTGSLTKTRKRIEKIRDKSDELYKLMEEGFSNDNDFDRAFFDAFIARAEHGKVAESMLPECHLVFSEWISTINIVSKIALDEILPAKQSGKNCKWPVSFSPAEALVVDLAKLYHSKKGRSEAPLWDAALQGINHSWDSNEYSGPFFCLVKDFWRVLNVPVSRKNLLGKKIYDALTKMKNNSG